MRGSPRHGELQTLRLAVFAAAGFCIGGALGYMFIGTAHAVSGSAAWQSRMQPASDHAAAQVLITRDAAHYQDEGASLVGRLPGGCSRAVLTGFLSSLLAQPCSVWQVSH